jgi:hypothetical protein
MHRDFGTVVSITALAPLVISSYPLLPQQRPSPTHHIPRHTPRPFHNHH